MSRDLETQVIVVTKNSNFQKSLENEQKNLYQSSDKVTQETYKENSRLVPLWVRFVMPIIKAFF